MKIITDTATIPVVIPPRPKITAPVTPRITVSGQMNACMPLVCDWAVCSCCLPALITSPDFAYTAITNSMNQAKESIAVFIYQITDIMCSYVLQLVSQKPNLKWTVRLPSCPLPLTRHTDSGVSLHLLAVGQPGGADLLWPADK
jgi:hypothetical protein